MKRIRVMIIDDSALVRESLKEVFSSDPAISVIATAGDPYIAVRKMKREKPDVILLDVELPRMDGITFLKKIMRQHPIPVVVCTGDTREHSDEALKAFEYGAVEVIRRPEIGTREFFDEARVRICDIVKAAAATRTAQVRKTALVEKSRSADVILDKPVPGLMHSVTEKVIVIGSSTGGTEALRKVLEKIPLDAPGIVVAQHMPEVFTAAFAERLDTLCTIQVKEAENYEVVRSGKALIARGNYHILLKRRDRHYYVELNKGPLVTRHRPSVNVLFRSAARYAGKNALGVILTGMGDDGAQGMLEMKEAGAFNIAQDEESCVVFGMPCEAIKLGGVDKVMPLSDIAGEIIRRCC